MDRSFLSRPEVVQASRKFVCIRLATYEDREEAQVLKSIYVGGSGEVENTTFALLAPDGRTLLARPGRSPQFAFPDSAQMAQEMHELARAYPPRPTAPALPRVSDLRLAINVAACDNLPVIAAIGSDPASRQALEAKLAPLAWTRELAGHAVWSVDTSSAAAGLLGGARGRDGFLVIQPGTYGLNGRVLAWVAPGSRLAVQELQQGIARFQPLAKNAHDHIRAGHRQGVHWQTKIPVTDPHRPPGAGGRRR
jgi:hypothetical protein